MALHKDFPKNPYAILDPSIRWFPADEKKREEMYKLVPPFVHKLRLEVKKWRDENYKGASDTSRALLRWWFQTEHPTETPEGIIDFQYYFAQREAIETVIYLYEVVEVKDKNDFFRYDSSGAVSSGMFPEDWLRMVIKMATGSGKTKVMSLLVAWSYFHKSYEKDSNLARNFLLITPNIIVLDRIKSDFEGLKIFFTDPVLPENGFEGQNWKDDFQMTLHLQDNINSARKTGNIFLTNIHRVYNSKDKIPNAEDENTMNYFLGDKPVANTNDSKVNIGEIARDLDELMILNDEAHHIHDEKLAWFKSIEDISNRMKMKDKFLSLQIDLTATPKHNNGAIFVQTISDYPLVEAIHQNIVKHPVLPDPASRAKLQEYKTSKFTEKYKDYIHLGYLEWKKVYDEHKKLGKKAVLFVMTDDTKNCDDVNEYLQNTYPELKNAVLTIHTKNNGEIAETATGKKEEELKILRKASNNIDNWESPHKAIVSVLMLKEGWDVKNVTTIVGLRAYSSKSNILPEQTLGRGLRLMYGNFDVIEEMSVIGTDAFMEFVNGITREGVELEYKSMGEGIRPNASLIVEIDNENTKKDIVKLDIEIPVLSARIYREYKNISELNVGTFKNKKLPIKNFSEKEKKEIVFCDIVTGKMTHITIFDSDFIPNYQSVIGYFANIIRQELRLVGGHNILHRKVKEFVSGYLFDKEVDLEDMNILRNLSEIEATKTIIETFKKEINDLTVMDKGEAEIKDYIKISKARTFVMKDQGFVAPKKSVFNKIVGDSHFELQFAGFLEQCDDIVSYAKNYFAVHFKIDYKDAGGNIRDFYPDFFVKVSDKEIYIVETKGREDLDDIEKIKRLYQWCEDINIVQKKVKFTALYVKQDDWERYKFKNFDEVARAFKK
ncbi:MAG: DEAD/DEAH box helicase family protein [Patescibacteria group bacterium]